MVEIGAVELDGLDRDVAIVSWFERLGTERGQGYDSYETLSVKTHHRMAESKRCALITGITGQDGSYLAEHLLEKGYEVHGIKRRASSFNTTRIDHLYQDPHELTAQGNPPKLTLHYGDLSDGSNLQRIIEQVQPDEIYNLGAQSHVAVSFEAPEYTANVDALGTLRILEAIRILGLTEKTRIYQASTSSYMDSAKSPQKAFTKSPTVSTNASG